MVARRVELVVDWSRRFFYVIGRCSATGFKTGHFRGFSFHSRNGRKWAKKPRYVDSFYRSMCSSTFRGIDYQAIRRRVCISYFKRDDRIRFKICIEASVDITTFTLLSARYCSIWSIYLKISTPVEFVCRSIFTVYDIILTLLRFTQIHSQKI